MSETLACRLTASVAGALATIAVRGPHCLPIVDSCLNQPHTGKQWSVGCIRFVRWPILNWVEHVVACRVDEQTLELHCHGGMAVSNAILEALREQGCRIVDQLEWVALAPETTHPQTTASSPRYWLKHLCNRALIQATSERTAGILLDQANGALYSYFEQLNHLLSSERWVNARELINSVARWNELGRHLLEPWRVVLAGPPNVGKSSLINALSGKSLSIVHPEAGTTRDWIETQTQVDGWPISLTDTAGIRATEELVEREGVSRAFQQIGQAHLVIIVVDSTLGWTRQHEEILEMSQQTERKPHLFIAWNKSDLVSRSMAPKTIKSLPVVPCSAQGEISSLLTTIAQTLVPEQPTAGQAILFDPRHQQLQAEILDGLQIPVAPNSADELKLFARQLLFGRFPSLF